MRLIFLIFFICVWSVCIIPNTVLHLLHNNLTIRTHSSSAISFQTEMEQEEEGDSSFEDLAFTPNIDDNDAQKKQLGNGTAHKLRDPIELLAKAIDNMSLSHHDPKIILQHEIPSAFCAHPIHLHSLTRLTNISTIFRSRFSICALCEERISLVAGDVVTCLACSIFYHRQCTRSDRMRICSVNGRLLEERKQYSQHDKILEESKHLFQQYTKDGSVAEQRLAAPIPISELGIDKETEIRQDDRGTIVDNTSRPILPRKETSAIVEEEAIILECSEGSSDSSHDGVWSDAGPPAHWALSSNASEALRGIKSSSESKSKPSKNGSDESHEEQEQEQEQEQDWKATFSNLSRVLQSNVFANGGDNIPDAKNLSSSQKKGGKGTGHIVQTNILSASDADSQNEKNVMENSKALMQRISQTIQSQEQHTNDCILKGKVVSDVLKEADPTPTKTQRAVKGTVEVVKKTKKSMGVASMAGGIAGATAGLIIGGPAGAYVGSKIGQAVGVAGVIIEGTIGVGVLVAGVTGTVLTVKQLKGDENRIVAIGGKGSEQVVLVRPNVVVDCIWDEITMNARRSAPKNNFVEGLSLFGNKVADKKERKRRDRDIVFSEEEELNTKDKVFLLVTSSLNDKRSLPGYVYRELIGEVKNRAQARKDRSEVDAEKNTGNFSRAMRQDVHGIIKHITATLLEVRPGFCSSTLITELSAMAVETIVFGELYNHVMEEIKIETNEKDRTLTDKISALSDKAHALGINLYDHISMDAIKSIEMLPFYHSVEEKLRCCVELLECVSNAGSNSNMGADFLLTLICQHLAVAAVPYLNAECAFLEEFAKDEQLLQGKEGYALVTIQASLHFLNASKDTVQDLF